MTDTPKDRAALEVLLEIAASTGLGCDIIEGIEDAGLAVVTVINHDVTRAVARALNDWSIQQFGKNLGDSIGAAEAAIYGLLAASPYRETSA